jgi:polyhydroxyalkanoate synthesis regulator phasin
VKLSKTTIGIPLAALMLVVAAGAVLATTGTPASQGANVPAAASASPSPSAAAGTGKLRLGDNVLNGVLDELVTKGTITSAQEKAILDAVTAERTARREARQENRQELKADRQQLRGFLSDGVITKDEFDKLPADSPLRQLTSLMDDGKITLDELRSIGRGLFGGRGHGFLGGKGLNPAPSVSPSPTTGG